jgi:DNA-binding IclR family transcriptional regulator
VLQAVQSEPGISTRDVAERIGIAANQVHGIVSRLIKEGALHREDGALHPAAGSSNGAPTPEVAPESAASE